MTQKKNNFWKETFLGFAIGTIIKAAVVIVVITLLSLLLLNIYTRHGKSEEVPDVKNMPLTEAISMLERHQLKYEIIDSVFIRSKKPGIIMEQNPAPNTVVKSGRQIYLIINSISPRKIILPDLRDISLRQAEAMASSMGIKVATVEYASSEYKDLVLDVKYNGKSLAVGTPISEGSSITIVAGSGSGAGTVFSDTVPSVKGLTLAEAINLLYSTPFVIGGVNYDVSPNGDENDYFIYAQNPTPEESGNSSVYIDVWLSKERNKVIEEQPVNPRPKKESKQGKVKDIEDFF